VKRELVKHLLPLLVLFLLISVVWTINNVAWYQYVLLFIGLGVGSFILDIDHLIYWYYLNPDLQESKVARLSIAKRDFGHTLKLLEFTHKSHTSLIFHHYLFQLVLVAVSIFIFTSSANPLGKGLVFAINYHLLVDQLDDFKSNPAHLQNWLFARSGRQLPQKYLKHYLIFFSIITIVFGLLLITSR
jgi:hypothetical protein